MRKPDIQLIAVKGVVTRENGDVLILKQNDSTISNHQRYHPPGGSVDPGESLHEALAREIQEETRMSVKIKELLNVGEWQAERDDEIMQFIGIFYHCTTDQEVGKLQTNEVSEASWVNLENLDSFNILEPSKSIIKQFLEKNN